jgi:ABC-2 type transport system permease protein
MPDVLRIVSRSLPLTEGITISQSILDGKPITPFQIILLCINSALYLLLGMLFFRFIYRRSRKKGLHSKY